MSIKLRQLSHLLALDEHGNFSRAANELCVTQSAVSHQIRGLEAWFGAPLFERAGNRATLMPHGAELAAALADAGLVPADTTAEQTAQWFLDGFDGAPFDITDPAVGEILSQVGVAVAHG